jgi:hypothetical protein
VRRGGAGEVVRRGFLFTCCTGRLDSCFCSVGDNFKDQVDRPRGGGVLWPTNLHRGKATAEGYGKPNSVWSGGFEITVSARGVVYPAFAWWE